MASYNKKQKLSFENVSALDVMKNGKEKAIPWDKIFPEATAKWLETYSKANNTTRDLILASILPTVSCLMGETTVKVECKLRPEQINLFMVCLCAPGSGKSPAFQNACSQPVRLYVEEQQSTALFVDEFTEVGLFQQLKSTAGNKAIIGKEVSQFFDQILQGGKDKSRIDVERIIQLYDGATWVYTKGDKSSRQLSHFKIVQNPGVSIVGYSQPQRFFPIYVKLKERRDGAIDRMLIYQPMPLRITSTETKEFIRELNQSPMKDLRAVYDEIYSYCHDENGSLMLILDQSANKKFEEYIDRMAAYLNKQLQENRHDEDVSKDDRHVLRLAGTMHMFFHVVERKLKSEPTVPPPTVITGATLERAISLTNYFAEQRKVLDQLNVTSNKGEVDDSISAAIISSPGPFITVRQVQNSFSGKKRSVSSSVVDVMKNLEKDEMGSLRQVERTFAFYKSLPCDISDETLSQYKVSREDYLKKFTERAPLSLITKELFNKLLDDSPQKEELGNLYSIEEE